MTLKRCDICQRYEDSITCDINGFAMRQEVGGLFGAKISWEPIDICEDCLRTIKRLVKEGKA